MRRAPMVRRPTSRVRVPWRRPWPIDPTRTTQAAGSSGVPFDAYMASELGGRLAALEENAYTVGDGSGKPLRIAHASSGITTVTAATGSTTSFKAADIKAAFKALPAAYRPFASWLFHPDDFRGVGGASRHRRRARVPDAARGAADVVRPARADPPETCRRRRRMRARRLSVT